MYFERVGNLETPREEARSQSVVEGRILVDRHYVMMMFIDELSALAQNPQSLPAETPRTGVKNDRTAHHGRFPYAARWSSVLLPGHPGTDNINAIPVLPKLLQRIPERPLLALKDRTVAGDHQKTHGQAGGKRCNLAHRSSQ